MRPTRCPTCGTELGDRNICPRCGTLVGAELAISRIKGRARSLLDQRLPVLPPIGPYHFLWACAFMPIVLLPPIVSFSVSISSMRKLDRGADAANFEWIAIISVINLVISAIILYKFHFSPAELTTYILSFVKYIIHSVSSFLPLQRSSPRLVPI